MKVVIQRVSRASVEVEGKMVSSIDKGLLILLGVTDGDAMEDIDWLIKKITQLRIFEDEAGVMNVSAVDAGAAYIVVSQFTLHASTKKGNRPSYIKAARPEVAEPLYEAFVEKLRSQVTSTVGTGIFGADMKVSLVNEGPVTIIIDTQNKE